MISGISGAPFIVEWNGSTSQLAVDQINANPSTGTTEKPPRQQFQSNGVSPSVLEPFYINSSNELGFLLYFRSGAFDVNPNAMFWGYRQVDQTNWNFQKLYQTNWASDWDVIKPFYLNNSTYLFFYKHPLIFGNGTAAIDLVAADGVGSNEVWRSDGWSKDWAVFEPFYEVENTYILECKKRNSEIAIDQVNANGQGTTELWRGGGLSANADIVKIFYNGRLPYVLAYESATGAWAVSAIRYDNLKGLTALSSGTWAAGGFPPRANWARITPFYMNGGIYFFACNFERGLVDPLVSVVAIAQFNPSNNTITQIWTAEWQPGWLEVQAFYLPPTPYPPVVPVPLG